MEANYFEVLESLFGPQTFIKLKKFSSARFWTSVELLLKLLYERKALDLIIDAYAECSDSFNCIPFLRPSFQFEEISFLAFSFSDENLLELHSPELIPKLAAERVGINRLNRCAVCRNLYWIPRDKGHTCGRRCSLLFSQRRSKIKKMTSQLEKDLLPKLEKQKKQWRPDDDRLRITLERIQQLSDKIEKMSKSISEQPLNKISRLHTDLGNG